MLSPEDNKILTQVGPDTPMGELMRQYWMPALLSEEVAVKGGPPVRLRLLGEDLVAYRDSAGKVGIVDERCAHRGASLYYGRNEDCGLRCVYHGWKYDRDGNCVDMPNEPADSTFKDRIKLRACKVVERDQVIWAYLGEQTDPPPPPDLEWSLLPADQSDITKRLQYSNWAQTLEGGIDSSHASFLHTDLGEAGEERRDHVGIKAQMADRAPRFEVVDTPSGAVIGARRSVNGQYYWRVYQFLMPFYTMVPPFADLALNGHAFVPRDDESTLVWSVTWHPGRNLVEHDFPFTVPGESHGIHVANYAEPTPEADGRWIPAASRANDYLMDHEAQRNRRFSGIPGVPMQDAAMQESMGPIYDRTREHLGSSDAAILRVRRRWLRLAKALRDGQDVVVPGADRPADYMVRSAAAMFDEDVNWYEAIQDWTRAEPGSLKAAL